MKKFIVIIDTDAMTEEEIAKLEAVGCVVVKKNPQREVSFVELSEPE